MAESEFEPKRLMILHSVLPLTQKHCLSMWVRRIHSSTGNCFHPSSCVTLNESQIKRTFPMIPTIFV